MKIQDLQQPYRALAEMRREQQINSEWVKKWEDNFNLTQDLSNAFYYEITLEGLDWWCDVNDKDTPEIPAESLSELKEWKNKHPEYDAVLIAEQPKEENPFLGYEDKLFTAAVAAMQGMLFQNFQGSNEDMSNIAWDIAESLINEGKKRNLL